MENPKRTSAVIWIFLVWVVKRGNAEPFPAHSIKEVAFTGGVAGATSFHNKDWPPEKAFRPNQPIDSGWHLGPDWTRPSNMPVMIWYDLKSWPGVRPAEISFQPAQKNANIRRGPTSYQFVASNDNVCNDGATWTVLCEDLSNTAWSGYQDTKYCRVKHEMKGKYRCLGLRVLKNQDPNGWVTLRNIRVWERIESP